MHETSGLQKCELIINAIEGREKKKEVESRGKEKEDGGWEEEEGRGERKDYFICLINTRGVTL